MANQNKLEKSERCGISMDDEEHPQIKSDREVKRSKTVVQGIRDRLDEAADESGSVRRVRSVDEGIVEVALARQGLDRPDMDDRFGGDL